MEGIVFFVTVKDANNKVVIVAVVVAGVGRADTYKHLLVHIVKHPGMAAWINKETTTYFVDGHKGSEFGVPAMVPRAERKRCLRYLIGNMKPPIGKVSIIDACMSSAGLVHQNNLGTGCITFNLPSTGVPCGLSRPP